MTILDSFKIQEIQNLPHIYLFEYTWSNARQIIIYSPHDLEKIGEINIHELVGIIFSKKEIPTDKSARRSISELKQILQEAQGKIVFFEKFKKF